MRSNLIILLAFVLCALPLGVQNAHAGDAAFRTTHSVLVVGDSLSIPLGQRLEEYFKMRPGIAFHRLGKVSSGLARPNFFNWETNLQTMAERHKPDTVFIMIGTNDTKNLKTPSGQTRKFGSSGWRQEYIRRAQRLLDICRVNNPAVTIYWVGAPVMGRPRLDKNVRFVNSTLQFLTKRNANCTYVNTRDVLADGRGRYVSHAAGENGKNIRLRAKDGVHVTRAGSLLLADRCLETAIFSRPAAPAKQRKKERTRKRVAVPIAKAVHASAVPGSKKQPPRHAGWFYSIQESSWEKYEQALRRVRMLQKRGLPARVAKVNLGARGVWHRVMIGAFHSLKRARREKRELHAVHDLDHALIMKIRKTA